MAKVRVGLIGAGQIAELHARAYADNPTGELYAVADIDPDAAEALAGRWGAKRRFTDYREMLADPALDAVEILLPHHLHLEATEAALAAGKHVSLQKPPAPTIAETDRMIAAATRAGKLFRVFENFRSYEPYMRTRDLIEAGEIGDPLSIRLKVVSGTGIGGWVQTAPAREWRLDPVRGGGPPAIIDHGYHQTSIVLFLMGRVEKVHAMVDSTFAGTSRHFGSPCVITWKHEGAQRYGSWECVRSPELLVPTRYYAGDEWTEVTGTRGIVWVTRCSGNLLGAAPVILYRDGEMRHFADMETDWADSFRRCVHEFTAAIVDGTQPDLDGLEARHALAFSLAAMRSGEEHREVALGEIEGG